MDNKLQSITPSHVAIIMDGNGRWALGRHLPRAMGHAKGATAVKAIVEKCAKQGVKYLTLFAFSTENWTRPADEVSALMGLFLQYLEREIDALNSASVKLSVIGNLKDFSSELQTRICEAETATQNNLALTLTLAANYGGRWDVVQAINKWQAVNPGESVTSLTEEQLSMNLSSADLPEPDLLIRTGGERRLSNFMLWQSAYTELYFTDVLWPDFDGVELDKALCWFATRERRFGKV